MHKLNDTGLKGFLQQFPLSIEGLSVVQVFVNKYVISDGDKILN